MFLIASDIVLNKKLLRYVSNITECKKSTCLPKKKCLYLNNDRLYKLVYIELKLTF